MEGLGACSGPYLVIVLQAWRGDHLALFRLDQPVQELLSSHLRGSLAEAIQSLEADLESAHCPLR